MKVSFWKRLMCFFGKEYYVSHSLLDDTFKLTDKPLTFLLPCAKIHGKRDLGIFFRVGQENININCRMVKEC
jgi:hypothetical protein